MLNEKDIYLNVSQIDICNSYTIIWYHNLILINNKELVSGNINYFKRFKNSFLVETNEGDAVYIYDLNNFSRIQVDRIGEFLTEKIILIGNWNQDYTIRVTKAIDFNDNKELWKSEKTFLIPFGFNDDSFFTLKNNFICLIKAISSETIWQYDLSTKYNWQQKADYIDQPDIEKQAEVIKFLGVYKNELWLVLNSGALLALDIETGAESRYIKEGKMLSGEADYEDFKGYFGYDTILDEKTGLIFNLNRHFYLEYNINSVNDFFDSYSFKESSANHKLNLNYVGGFDDEYIYSYEGSNNNRFAVFSRDKKEIIWSSEIEEVKGKFPAIRDLQYGAGKIYVLDHDSTLHIFEKEQTTQKDSCSSWDLVEKAPFKDDIVKLRGFLSDIEKSTDLQDLVRSGRVFTKSWDWLKSLRPKIQRSREVIEALQDILESPSLKNILGDELDDILKKFMKAHEGLKWGWNKLSFKKHMILLKKMARYFLNTFRKKCSF